MSQNCQPPAVPAPLPPWARRVQSPQAQTLNDASLPVLLDPEMTYLLASLAEGAPNPITIALPNGSYAQQFKRFCIPTSAGASTPTWVVTGTYAGGFSNLTFTAQGSYAMLEWDGSGWQLAGGNAALS